MVQRVKRRLCFLCLSQSSRFLPCLWLRWWPCRNSFYFHIFDAPQPVERQTRVFDTKLRTFKKILYCVLSLEYCQLQPDCQRSLRCSRQVGRRIPSLRGVQGNLPDPAWSRGSGKYDAHAVNRFAMLGICASSPRNATRVLFGFAKRNRPALSKRKGRP